MFIDISKETAAILSERIVNNDFKNRLCCLTCKKDLLYTVYKFFIFYVDWKNRCEYWDLDLNFAVQMLNF